MKLGHAVLGSGRRIAPAALLVVAGNAVAAIQSRYNLPPPASKLAQDIHWLHDFMLIICGVIFVARVRRDVLFDLQAPQVEGRGRGEFHENTTVEIVWTVIPFIIVIVMALPATQVRSSR